VALERASQVRRIEDYYILEENQMLGKGCFAEVFRCQERATGDHWAVKVIDTSTLTREENRTLDEELSCMNLVRHPNVVFLKDVFETSSKVYIVMDLLEGGTIIDRINERGAFSAHQAKSVTRNILEGISYLHDAGIVHRDLKPSNIVFLDRSDDSIVKILDFGFSAFSRPQDLFTRPVGTLKYFAPELISGKGYNLKVDMWCLGLILYVMLTARFPFAGETQNQLLDNIENARFDKQSDSWKAIPDPAKNLIKRLLRLDPAQRLGAREALNHPWMRR